MRIAIIGSIPKEWFEGLSDLRKLPDNTTTWNANLAEGLASIPGVDVHFITLHPYLKKRQVVERKGVTVHFLPCIPKLQFFILFQEHRLRVNRELKRIQPDIVHGQGTEHPFAYLALTSPYPSLVTIHCALKDLIDKSDAPLISRFRHYYFYTVERYILPKAKTLIVTTPYMRSHYKERGIHANFHVIENPVDELFFTAGKIDHEPVEKLRWLYVGRISPEKGLEQLFSALRIVHDKGYPAKLRIVGPCNDESYRAFLNEHLKSLDLMKYVEFIGRKGQKEVAREIKTAYALVLPSHYEAFGLVLAESMAAGTPVVANNVGGIPFVVTDGKTGLLANPADIHSLADNICMLIGSPNRREELAINAQEEARHRFHPASIAQRTLAVYEEILDQGNP